MIIREMTVADIPAIHKMAKDEVGFRVADSQESCFWPLVELERWVTSGDDVLLVAEDAGKIVGFVLTTLHRPTGKVTLENQFVLPECRGKGIAKALMGEMEKQLKAKGATYLHFLVKVSNENMGAYENMGFVRGYNFSWFEIRL